MLRELGVTYDQAQQECIPNANAEDWESISQGKFQVESAPLPTPEANSSTPPTYDFQKYALHQIPKALDVFREVAPAPYLMFEACFREDEVPREYIPFTFSNVCGATIGDKMVIPWGKGLKYGNDWLLTVGPSGVALKGELLTVAKKVLLAYGADIYSCLGTTAGIRNQIAEKKGRGVLYNSELGFLFEAKEAKHNAGMFHLFCQYLDWSPTHDDYILRDPQKPDKTVKIKLHADRRLSWIAGIQDDILEEAIENRIITSGFLPRFSIVVGRTVPFLVPIPLHIKDVEYQDIAQKLKNVVKNMGLEQGRDRVFCWPPLEPTEAKPCYEQFYLWLWDDYRKGGRKSLERMGSFLRRLGDRLIKRAGVFSLMFEPDVKWITMKGLEPAMVLALIELATLEHYGGTIVSGDKALTDMRKVLEVLGERDPQLMTRVELRPALRDAGRRNQAIKNLEEDGLIIKGVPRKVYNKVVETWQLTDAGREFLGLEAPKENNA